LLYKRQFGNVGANEEIRQKYERLAEEFGKEYVHGILREKDPLSADRLHYNDVKRVIRALEIYDVTGKAKSEQQDVLTPRFPFAAVSIDYPRDKLYNRINLRVEEMFKQGLLEEVQGLLRDGVTEEMQCMQGIGYKEIAEGLRIGATEAEMMEIVKNNTRKYAKRQQTFFKRMQNHTYLAPEEATTEKVYEILNDR
jgi:tRNA dimethylallyltransferase